MRDSQRAHYVPVLEPQDHQAGVDGDSIHMGKGQGICFCVLFGELTGDAVLKVYSGATAGTKTTAETFHYAATAADLKVASGDVLAAFSTSAALTLTAGTYEDRMLIVEIDHDDVTDAQPWVTLEFSSDASELFVSVSARVLPRYGGDQSKTVIA